MRILNVQWKWNVPNALSLLRIVLIVPFVVLYLTDHMELALLMLVLSGISDMLDGIIARRFNQITDCGKLLDPLSDKLTQVAVVIALTIKDAALLPLTVLCFSKEAIQAIGAVVLLMLHVPVRGAEWYGKLSTIVFYVCMSIMVAWEPAMGLWDDFGLLKSIGLARPQWLPLERPQALELVLIVFAGIFMLVAFIGYAGMFLKLFKKKEEIDISAEQLSEKG